ncbi:hypothetical protein C7427_1321, partial [Pantoea ananatis]
CSPSESGIRKLFLLMKESKYPDRWQQKSASGTSLTNYQEPPPTISREIKRHGGAKQYRAAKADTDAWESALRPKPCKLIESPTLCKIIAEKMHQDWSPEQIAGWLKRCYPDNQ